MIYGLLTEYGGPQCFNAMPWTRYRYGMAVNLQLTSRFLYKDVSSFAYRQNRWVFNNANYLFNFLTLVDMTPSVSKERQFGTVILDVDHLNMPSFRTANLLNQPLIIGRINVFTSGEYRSNFEALSSPVDWAHAITRLLRDHKVVKLAVNEQKS
jgi:hypothetical protein